MLSNIMLIIMLLSGVILITDFIFLAKRRSVKSKYVPLCEIALIISALIYFISVKNFEFVLTFAVIVSGAICLLDKLFFSKLREKRHQAVLVENKGKLSINQKEFFSSEPVLVDYSKSFFWVLLLVLVLRSFVFEPFRIPSGSLEPTLLPGDFILVNKYSYGLRLPVINKTIIPVGKPKRGEIFVFHWPVDPNKDFIKRAVAIPGDTVSYIDKVFYINGQEAEQELQKDFNYALENGSEVPAQQYEENLLGVKHGIYRIPSRYGEDFENLKVPEGMYLMVGDNRDDSDDSRFWGFVSEDQIVGKPIWVLFNWKQEGFGIDWSRVGMSVQVDQDDLSPSSNNKATKSTLQDDPEDKLEAESKDDD